jgi:PAS domain S-box-containing protein
MSSDEKTPEQLLAEVEALRARLAEWEGPAGEDRPAPAAAAEALRDSEARYRALFDHNPQPMFVYDAASLRYLAVNDAAVRHYGYPRDEFLALSVRDICLADDAGAGPKDKAQKHRTKSGAVIDVEADAHRILFGDRPAWLVLATDVSRRKRLEEQLRQAHKMDAVGRLAGGVAHEFNNLVTVIAGYSQLLLDRLEPANPLRDNAEEIKRAAERAAALTAQLLAFGRRVLTAPRVLDLNVLLGDSERALRHLLGVGVELVFDPGPQPVLVQLDPGQFHQVLINLALNAREAMPNGGRLTLRTTYVELDEANARRHLEVTPGPYVLLAVTDTGRGMSAEVRAHLFEPFFTTKEVGEGIGLGLSTAYGIVKQSGGHIEVDSEPGRGTEFRIYLPSVEASPQSGETPTATALPRGETVLVVEDEELVRNLVRYILQQEGYTVLEAADGLTALQLSERHRGPIHLLVADVLMPRMGGPELARRLLATRPTLPVLFLSGYTGQAPTPADVDVGDGGNLLHKPFSPRELARKVRELLDARSESSPE